MPAITVEVPDERAAEFYVWFGQWLGRPGIGIEDCGRVSPAAGPAVGDAASSTATAPPSARWVRESGHEKLAWDSSVDAVRAARVVIDTTTGDAHPLLKAFIEDPHLEVTTEELAKRADLSHQVTQAYRNLLGRQAFYAAGKRCNPITSRSKRGSTQKVLFMTAEARHAFSVAFRR